MSHLDHASKSLYAFTLSEIIVALGIVGLISALSIPTIITDSRERQHRTLYKENISLLENSLKQYGASANYGSLTFSQFMIDNLKHVKSGCIEGTAYGTAPACGVGQKTQIVFENGSEIQFDSQHFYIYPQADNSSESITLIYNANQNNDVVISSQRLHPLEVTYNPTTTDREAYIKAIGLKVGNSNAQDYQGEATTTTLESGSAPVNTRVVGGSSAVDTAHNFGVRDDGDFS
ncbi:MAG: type II secretion system protein [Vampirovibrio sp.]